MLTELELAFFDSSRRTFANLDHMIRMLLTEATLFALHAGDVIAVHAWIGCRAKLKFAKEPVNPDNKTTKNNQMNFSCSRKGLLIGL